MPCYTYKGKRPKVATDAWIAPTAVLIGDVTVRAGASIWWGAVLRADEAAIEIGERSNVQDNCVIHTEASRPTIIGSDVTIGHLAMVHSAIVGDHVLIGLSASLVGPNRIGEGCVIAGGSVLPEGFDAPPRSFVAGVPAKLVRRLGSEHDRWTHRAAVHYDELSREYRDNMDEVPPEPLV